MRKNALREEFVSKMTTQGWKEYAREWYVVPNMSNYGIGDLVMTRADGQYVVIEVKFIDWKTANKTKKRKEVKEQAAYYFTQRSVTRKTMRTCDRLLLTIRL